MGAFLARPVFFCLHQFIVYLVRSSKLMIPMPASLTAFLARPTLLLDLPAVAEDGMIVLFVAFCALVGFGIYWIVKRANKK
jgi:hypothetical protein